jgi:hypothetical protein
LIVSSVDGAISDTVAHGIEEAGVHRVAWDGTGRPDGHYSVSFEAAPVATGVPFVKQSGFSKQRMPTSSPVPIASDSLAELFPITTVPLELQRSDRVFRLSVEGGAAYLAPQKESTPFDNLFSHVALAIGMALTNHVEAGIIFGQDGFHQVRAAVGPIVVPGTGESVETRIVTWVGGYGRYAFALGGTRTFVHASVASGSGGAVSTLGIGMSVLFSSGISLFLMPHVTNQWDVHPSTKWGLNYGLAFQF